MKKLNYFIVLIASIFSLNMLVSAETCTYNLSIPPLDYNDNMMGFLYSGNDMHNEYAFMRAYASFKSTERNSKEALEFYDDLKKLNSEWAKWILDSNYHDFDMDFIGNDIRFKYDTTSKIGDLSYSIYDYGNGVAGKNGSLSIGKRGQAIQNYEIDFNGYCPDAVSIIIDGQCSAGGCITVKGYNLKDYGYNYFNLIDAANYYNGKATAILYRFSPAMIEVNENGDQQQNNQLLAANMCTIKTYSSSFHSDVLDEIKAIIDKATVNKQYNIRDIYDDVVDLSEDEVKTTIEKIKNEKGLSNADEYMIKNYITTLPYFDLSSAKEAYDSIQIDLKQLNDFKSNYSTFEDCVKNAYGLDIKESLKKYRQYDKNYQGLYTDAMINLLEIFTLENIESWYETTKEMRYMDDIRSECQNLPDQSARENCEKNAIKNDINNISCSELVGKTQLTPAEKVLKDELDKLCEKSKNANCYISNCDKAKNNNDLSKEVENLINGDTEAQKKAGESIDEFYEGLLKHVGIDLTGMCKLFEEGTVLREYTDLGLNIIRIAGPILVIILVALDGIKAIASQNEDQMKKFYSHIKIRLICLLLLFFIPTVIGWLIDIVEIPVECTISVK